MNYSHWVRDFIAGGLLLLAVGAARATTYYVDVQTGCNANDGLTPQTATQTIQAAIDRTSAGDCVEVAPGIYATGSAPTPPDIGADFSRICITNSITVQSTSGAQKTFIEGKKKMRCAVVRGESILRGFTLRNGQSDFGGGAFLTEKGCLQTCVLSDNQSQVGGGAFLREGGTLQECTLSNNGAKNKGGGIVLYRGGTLRACHLSGNRAENGGGGIVLIEGGILEHCTLSNNRTATCGGGAFLEGGGSLQGCILTKNRSEKHGGGAFLADGGMLQDCVLSENHSSISGGGAALYRGGLLKNCTVVENRANKIAGGAALLQGGTVQNSILWENQAEEQMDLWNRGGSVEASCAATDVSHGVNGCLTNNPRFVGNNAVQLQPDSPCAKMGPRTHPGAPN